MKLRLVMTMLALSLAGTALGGVRDDWLEVASALEELEGVEGSGLEGEAAQVRSALSRLSDEDLEYVYGATDLHGPLDVRGVAEQLRSIVPLVATAQANVELANLTVVNAMRAHGFDLPPDFSLLRFREELIASGQDPSEVAASDNLWDVIMRSATRPSDDPAGGGTGGTKPRDEPVGGGKPDDDPFIMMGKAATGACCYIVHERVGDTSSHADHYECKDFGADGSTPASQACFDWAGAAGHTFSNFWPDKICYLDDICGPSGLGACCHDAGCVDSTQDGTLTEDTCTGSLSPYTNGRWFPDKECSQLPSNCSDPSQSDGTGACCTSSGCDDTGTMDQCDVAGGETWLGTEVQCSQNPCSPSRSACCLPDDTCTELFDFQRCEVEEGGTFHSGATCASTSCGGGEGFPSAGSLYPTNGAPLFCYVSPDTSDANRYSTAQNAITILKQVANTVKTIRDVVTNVKTIIVGLKEVADKPCKQIVVVVALGGGGGNASVACIPAEVAFSAANVVRELMAAAVTSVEWVTSIADEFFAYVAGCDDLVLAAEALTSYRRLGHVHGEVQSIQRSLQGATGELATHDLAIKGRLDMTAGSTSQLRTHHDGVLGELDMTAGSGSDLRTHHDGVLGELDMTAGSGSELRTHHDAMLDALTGHGAHDAALAQHDADIKAELDMTTGSGGDLRTHHDGVLGELDMSSGSGSELRAHHDGVLGELDMTAGSGSDLRTHHDAISGELDLSNTAGNLRTHQDAVLGDLGQHDAAVQATLDLGNPSGDLATHHQGILNALDGGGGALDAHDANIDADLAAHDADIKAALDLGNPGGDLATHDARLLAHDANLAAHDANLAAHDANLDADLATHHDEVMAFLEAHEGNDSVLQALADHDANIDGDVAAVDAAVADVDADVAAVDAAVADVDADVAEVDAAVADVDADVAAVDAAVADVDADVAAVDAAVADVDADVAAVDAAVADVDADVAAVDAAVADVDADVAEVDASLEAHDANIDGDLQVHDASLSAHDVNMQADLQAHDANIDADVADVDADLQVHDANIDADVADVDADLQAHDANIDADLAAHDASLSAHDANIDGDLRDHDANIDADLAAHDLHLTEHDDHINADLEAHDTRLVEHDELMDEQHREILARLAGGRVQVEMALASGDLPVLFAIPGGALMDPAALADGTCPGLDPAGLSALHEDGLFETVRCVTRGSIDLMASLGYSTRTAERHFDDGEESWADDPPDYRSAVEDYGQALRALMTPGSSPR